MSTLGYALMAFGIVTWIATGALALYLLSIWRLRR